MQDVYKQIHTYIVLCTDMLLCLCNVAMYVYECIYVLCDIVRKYSIA